ncbi:minor tail protein [Arthrobacter phage Zeina]|nr:minor tail protein [Arthrobacter phage Zeina]
MALTPTDPTKAQIWIRGTAPDQIIDLYVPRGAKGDPGPWVETSLAETTDLNSVVTSGLYKVAFSTQNPNLLNYPTSAGLNGWIIEVRSQTTNTRVIQRAIMTNGSGTPDGRAFYERRLNSGTWSPWRLFASTRVDQTAGRTIYQWDDLNSREQLVWGDTGNRDISNDQAWNDALFSGTAVAKNSANLVRLRRVGSTVELYYAYDRAAGSTVSPIAGFPLGFRPANPVMALGCNSGMVLARVYHGGGASALSYNTQGTAASAASVNMVFTTTDPWPTTLPGTAINTIPNT